MNFPSRILFVVFALLFVSSTLHAQSTQPTAPTAPADDQEANFPLAELEARGLTFDPNKLPMCKIDGPEGKCRVEAFAFGETNDDKNGWTCDKLNKSTYVGRCMNGKLQGLSLVMVDGKKKRNKEAVISYFLEGHIAYPALTSFLSTPNLDFGLRERDQSWGCVYFGEWDKSAQKCKRFIQIYGSDIFTEDNARALRDGTFDLAPYRPKFVEFMHSTEPPAPTDKLPESVIRKLMEQYKKKH